ncbi:MAG: hypothetical protein AAF489_10735 [Bacteroidota bacterium]
MNPDNNITQEQLEQIERYLQDTMPDEQRRQFEHQLQSDKDFRLLVEDVKVMLLGVESASLKSNLEQFHDEMVPVRTLNESESSKTDIPTKKTPPKILKYLTAAAIVIFIGAFWLESRSSTTDRLYAKHFKPDPGLPTTMGATQNFKFYDAMVNYKQGEYEIAISKWETLLSSEQKNDTLHYFMGVAHLADGNEKKAIDYLQKLTENGSNSFKKETAYYLGLAYLKADNVEDAKKYLTFSETESAQQLLSELND